MKLATKLVLALFMAFLLAFGLHSYLRVRWPIETFQEDMRTDQHLMGRALGAALVVAWRNGGESEAIALVRDANEREDQIRIRWMDSTATEKAGLPAAVLSQLSRDQEISLILGDKEQHPRQFTYIPIRLDGGRRGVLELSESLLPLHNYTRKAVINAVITAGLLAMMCGLVSITLGFWLVGRPVRALREKARQKSVPAISQDC